MPLHILLVRRHGRVVVAEAVEQPRLVRVRVRVRVGVRVRVKLRVRVRVEEGTWVITDMMAVTSTRLPGDARSTSLRSTWLG